MSEATETFNSISGLVLRGARTMLGEERYPAGLEEWDQVLNWIALNVEAPEAKVLEVLGLVVVLHHVPRTPAYLRQLVAYQREERRKMGLPLP